jgi:hypothetical protein
MQSGSESGDSSGSEPDYKAQLQLAQQKRQEGNQEMAAKRYMAALDAYTSASRHAACGSRGAAYSPGDDEAAACQAACEEQASIIFSNM